MTLDEMRKMRDWAAANVVAGFEESVPPSEAYLQMAQLLAVTSSIVTSWEAFPTPVEALEILFGSR